MKSETLDSLVSKSKIPAPDLLKIDVKRADPNFLMGGISKVKWTLRVTLEIPALEYSSGFPKFDEITKLMVGNSFVPCEITDNHKAE